ncbi:MAG: hypothetical protein HY054_05755 [Proteobacteria bacterium]|nr:hypothetical protein [Pseudomonadota bacterium]
MLGRRQYGQGMAAGKETKSVRRAGARAVSIEPNAKIANALAESSWAEADEALAEALVEFAALKRALGDEPGRRASDALDMLAQALSRAKRRRGLSLFGEIGEESPFDEHMHELSGAPGAERVRIVREGAMRGREVLIRAVVAPARRAAKKRAPR